MNKRLRNDRWRLAGRSWLFLALLVGLGACVTKWTPPVPQSYHRTAPIPDALEFVGADECEACHEEVGGYAPAPEYHEDCESCHGPGELHADSEEPTEIRFPANDDCISCHGKGRKTHLAWTTSEHERTGVLCSDCHDLHNREPRKIREASAVQGAVLRHGGATSQLCASCHTEIAASLNLPSHHPVREGMLDCADCHPPHEDRRFALGARTALCTSCHEDHAGPWIFEHTPVAEDCTECHAVHGSASYNLLETPQPGLCISCHTVAVLGATHEPTAFVTRCTDCHGAVHGSYADPHLQR